MTQRGRREGGREGRRGDDIPVHGPLVQHGGINKFFSRFFRFD